MKDDNDNLHIVHWTDDPAQREDLLIRIESDIKRISRHVARRSGVEHHREDITSGVRAGLLEWMIKGDPDGPFAKDSPKAAADSLIEDHHIFKIARKLTGKIVRQESKVEPKMEPTQAEQLGKARLVELRPDIEAQLLSNARSLSRVISGTPNLTPRESGTLRKDVIRRLDADVPDDILDQFAEAAGTSGSEVRAFNEYHKQHGHLSDSDRKALSRARAKIKKTFPPNKFTSLLLILLALTLALYNVVHQDRSIRKNAFVKQGNLIPQLDVAHQGNLIPQLDVAHQGNLIPQLDVAHQGNLIPQLDVAHQGNLIPQLDVAHQGNLIPQADVAHQGVVITNRYPTV